MADRRRRSPEGSRKGTKKDSKGTAAQYYEQSSSAPQMRSRSPVRYSSSSSSSSSSSYLDISRTFPTHRSGIFAFFTAPSERRRLRKRRSKKLLRFNNSSSSSVNSDLAYGTGFIKRKKQRGVRSKHGKGIDRESERERERHREREGQTQRPGSGSGRRPTTDAEILAVGAGLAKLARDQNKLDLKAGKNGKRPDLGPSRESGYSSHGASRGLGQSKVGHGKGSHDDDGWESASDDESDSSINPDLAFSNESTVSFWPFGKKTHKPQSRKSSVVDPRLFGRQNSLNGILTEPVGMHGDVTWTSTTNFGPQNFFPSEPGAGSFTGASATASQTSLRQVYPVATDDPYRVDAARGRHGSSVVSGPDVYSASNRPEPVPLQHPKPFTPVSQSVLYETPSYTARTESGNILKDKPSSGKGKSIAEAALVGVAGVAIASAISDRKDDRKDKRREEEREQERIKRREFELDEERRRRRDSERKDSKDDRRRDRRESPDRSERKDKSKEKEREREKEREKERDKEREREKEKEKRKSDSKYSVEDSRHEKRKDETREEKEKRREREEKDKRREKRREDRRSEVGDDRYESRRTKSETAVVQTSVDPFQYQVERDQYNPTQTAVSAPEHRRVGSVPNVVTVEPDFGRQRSSSIKEGPSTRHYSEYEDYRRKDDDSRDRPLENGQRGYEEIVHSTAPYSEAAIAAGVIAAAAEGYRESRSSKRRDERRGEKSSDYDDRDDISRDKERIMYEDSTNSRSSPRDRDSPKERDPVQEEADRAYREIIMARKIASQVIRSRTPSPDRSVVGKYNHQEADAEIIRIVTPPEMKEHVHQKGPYDAPNADFRPDYVLTDPKELENFRIPVQNLDRSDPYISYLKRDPDADRPRPHLNLVHPTPAATPIPEKQIARSEPAKPSEKSREPQTTTSSDVAIEPRGDIVASPTASNISKGVTWGENETKHFEVESPHEHKEEFVTKDDVKKLVDRDQPKSPGSASKGIGWGAVAAAIGAGAGVAAASSNESSKGAKSTDKDDHQNTPYEYRGVIVEPEDTSRTTRQRSPPSPGPKPIAKPIDQSYASASKPQASHIPGAFDDDLDFTAHVAAGLQDTGFDPNIVINDPAFRRRDSPPGSNGPDFYRAPFSETVTDLGSVAPGSKGEQSFIIGDVDRTSPERRSELPQDDGPASRISKKEQKKRDKAASKQSFDDYVNKETSARETVEEPDTWFEAPKLSKKEQKKLDKAARQMSLTEEATTPVSASDAQQFVEEPESYFETPKKSKKKSKKGASSYEEEAEDTTRNVTVPVHAFDDLQNGQDEWAEPKDSKKSKKKSKRDSEVYESPSQSAVTSEVGTELDRTSSKKSKDKSKRRSEGYEPSPSEVSLPPSTPSETSRDGENSDLRSSRKSNRDSGTLERDDSRSVVSSRHDDDEPRKKKKSRSSTKDDLDDTRSVASAPVGDEEDRKQKKDKKSGGFFGLFGSKSEVGAPDESPKVSKDDFEDVKKKGKKEKRRSMPDAGGLYGNPSSQSSNDLSRNVSNGQSNGSHHYDDAPDPDARSDGEKKKSRSRAESTSSRKDSFLGNAGTLGAGVGIAGAAVAIAAQHHQQSKAAKDNSSEAIEHEHTSRSERALDLDNIFDPEIIPRQIRPSIDPQYGDLLPLPPSTPASPNLESLESLPDLPESRPGSPEAGRPSRLSVTPLRRNLIETPVKSPSHSAVPLKFMMGNRSTPSSPGLIRSPQVQSPENPQQETLSFPRSRPARPTSWDSTKEYKPLYLVESNRRLSTTRVEDQAEILPELPPSQRTSRSSSQHEHHSNNERFAPTFADDGKSPNLPLSIDTGLASSHSDGLLDSQQSTPRAGIALREALESSAPRELTEFRSSPPLPARLISQPPSPTNIEKSHHIDELVPAAAVAAGLVSTIGYFASSPRRPTVKEDWMDDLPSAQRRPSPVEPMTKDRSSYLLNSSPMYRKFDSDDAVPRDLPSPTLRGDVPYSAHDTLHSIEERDGSDIFGVGSAEQVMEPEAVASTPTIEVEPSEEFAVSKSKKDKKKDKKKGKGLSRSSTQDDVSYSIPGVVADLESSLPSEAGPVDDYDLPKSKKDKKKDKKKNKSTLNWDETAEENVEHPQQPIAETSREISEAFPAVADMDTTEEYPTFKSKKDKKKDKTKSKSAIVWDEPTSEEPPGQQFHEAEPESAKDITSSASTPFDTDPANEFFLPSSKSKKDKKNKKRSQVLVDTPVEPEQPVVAADELTADEFHDAPEGYVTPVDTTPFETPFEEFSTPQSNYGASGSKDAYHWEIKEGESSAAKEPPNTSWDVLATPAQITSMEADPFEDSQAPKLKKDKKKSKVTQALAFVGDDNVVSSEDAFSAIQNLPETSMHSSHSTAQDVFEDAMTPPVSKELPIEEDLLPKPMSGEESELNQIPHNPTVNVAEPAVVETSDPFETKEASEFALPKSKKEKKKNGKSLLSKSVEETKGLQPGPEEVAGDGQPLIAPTAVEDEELFAPKSKKDKKKDKKRTKSLAWEEDVPERTLSESVTEPVQDFVKDRSVTANDSTIVESNRAEINEENPSWTNEAVVLNPTSNPSDPQQETIQESLQDTAVENFGFVESKKGKKKKNKSKSSSLWADDQETLPRSEDPHQEISKLAGSIEDQDIISKARDNEESPKSVNPSFLPSETTINPTDQGLLPAAGIATIAGLGIAALHEDDSEASKAAQETKDGFNAGYNNDQLSLARQLQEEFAAKSSKKTKKDKKSRQSLPSTPDLESPRSRAAEEPTTEQPRSRSLSIGPSADRSADSPSTDLRKSLYREDQLELARQLKEEFGIGSKKSKKDKKKSQRTLTEDDALYDLPAAEVPTKGAAIESSSEARNLSISEEPAKRDGFEAGYQEDQLSLARQLQAEFGKKSKKDKKRQSTSQTPLEQEPRNDYFGESPQYAASDPSQVENTASNVESPAPDSGKSRDGLAAGYNEDQLELARQLKEEFGSGSKKSKKDKKGKQRESLLRSTTEDDFYSDAGFRVRNDLGNVETPHSVEGSGAVTPNAEDEFAPGSKKSKKDKKSKKRESLLRGNTDDNSFAEPVPPTDETEPQASENAQVKPVDVLGDNPSIEPEDEFASFTKKSKKDKKSKKRDSTIPSAVEENVVIETMPLGEQSRGVDNLELEAPELNTSTPVLADEEFSLSTKKSKKDKKKNKRESIVLSTDDRISAEPFIPEDAVTQPGIVGADVLSQTEPVTFETETEFPLISKKSKKATKPKNKENSPQLSSDDFGNAVEALHHAPDPEPEEVDIGTTEAAAPADDDWTSFSMSKKSKKDKKKRNQSIVAPDETVADRENDGLDAIAAPAQAIAPVEDAQTSNPIESKPDENKESQHGTISPGGAFYVPEPEINAEKSATNQDPPTAEMTPAAAAIEEENDNSEAFEFTTKKSKKDKKKRASLLRSSTFEGDHDQIPGTESAAPIPDHLDPDSEAAGALSEVPVAEDNGFEISGEKSKKDKKKRKSMQQAAELDDRFKDMDEPLTVHSESKGHELDIPTSETSIPPETIRSVFEPEPTADPLQGSTEAGVDDFAFTTKKSKKDKKKNKSLKSSSAEQSEPSTPLELVSEPISQTADIVENAKDSDKLSQVTDVPSYVLEQHGDDLHSTGFKKSENDEGNILEEPRINQLGEPREKSNSPNVSAKAEFPRLGNLSAGEPQASTFDDTPEFSTGIVQDAETSLIHHATKSPIDPVRELEIPTIDAEPGLATEADHRPESSQIEANPELPVQPSQDFDDAWGSISAKKTKKDKKKKKSGQSTPQEDFSIPESDSMEVTDNSQLPTQTSPAIGSTAQAAAEPDDEWANFSLKKSKKDKKKAKKSGLSTPLNEESETPFAVAVETTETTPAPAFSRAVAPGAGDDVADDDWTASFPAKKSKKDKKKAKSANLTPSEDIPVASAPVLVSQMPSVASPQDIETSTPDTSSVPPNQHALESKLAHPSGEEPREIHVDTAVAGVISESASDAQFQSVRSSPENEGGELVSATQGTASASTKEQVPDTGDEWDTLARKRSKKDKKGKKSGLSTPIAEGIAVSDRADETESAINVLDREVEDIPLDAKADTVQAEPDDEWGTFTKTSKKNKKSKLSDLSTPVSGSSDFVTPEESFDPEPFEQHVEGSIAPEADHAAPVEDEWSFPPVKLSKKDKKKNKASGLTTPDEWPSGAAILGKSIDPEQSIDQDVEEPVIPEALHEVQAHDEWSASPAKLSKKDKKKNKKSGSSTPADEASTAEVIDRPLATGKTLDKAVEAKSTPFKAHIEDQWDTRPSSLSKKDENEIEESDLAATEDNAVTPPVEKLVDSTERGIVEATDSSLPVADVEDEWRSGVFSIKKSKKDKKKERRSGLSTPIDMDTTDANPEQTGENSQASAVQPIAVDGNVSQPQILDETTEELSKAYNVADTPEPEFEFTTKKSKKDKKGKRSSKIGSEDISATSNLIAADNDKPLIPERQSTSPALLEHELEIPSKHMIQPDSTIEPDAAVAQDPKEIDDFTVELSRKSSKKDKRKRQPTIDFSTHDDSNSSKPPYTSWADEIEEAEVERQAPVIEEIAEDESLSHIASTTEASAIDDFSRPSKKGKKGKKRQSVEPDFTPEPARLVEEATEQREQSTESRGLSAFGVAGAALVGAAVTGAAKQAFDSNEEKVASIEVKETPSKRQSKKDKNKKGIDRRSAREDDIFDDPSLWEGAEAKAHEEVKDGLADVDAGDDGFWSPPQEEQFMDTTHDQSEILGSPSLGFENSTGGVVKHDISQRGVIDETREDSTKELRLSRDLEISRKEHEGDRLPTPEVVMPSVLVDEQYTSSPRRLSPVLHMQSPRSTATAIENEPKKSDWSFSTPTRAEQIIAADTQGERSPIRPFGSSKFALSGFSDLPAVEEEGPAQSEADNSRSLQSQEASYNRDSAFVSGSPIPAQTALFPDAYEPVRDSGVHLRDHSPLTKSRGTLSSSDDAIARLSWPSVDEDTETVDLDKSQRQSGASSKKHNQNPSKHHDTAITSRDHLSSQRPRDEKLTDFHQGQTGHGSPSLVRQRVQRLESPDFQRAEKPLTHDFADLDYSRKPKADRYQELSSSQIPKPDKSRGIDNSFPAAAALGAASLGFAAARQASLEKRPESAQSQRSSSNVNRMRTPDPRYRPDSVASNRSGTPPLRRTDRKISGDLRSLSQLSKPNLAKEAELAAIAASAVNTANPTANEGRVRAKDMADVYDGFGEGRMGSPRSPTRPHSMRRRQSMQVLELESRLESLAAENRMLSEANAQAERGLQSSRHTSSLVEKDAEIDALKRTLEWLQTEVTRLTEVNDGLTSANVTLGNQHNQTYGALEAQHAQATRELHEVRESHNTLTTGMQGIVAAQIQNATEEKDREISQLRASLDAAKEQIREMQRQILASKANDSDFLTIRDEDYFDTACQNLCQHVQQWVLRFSKFSDMRACRLTSEINNDKTIDRLDNAILDGSDVDTYLGDRIKRRDVFMSMTMTMVWEFVFTRYLFGMDREQRQKLKSLEKLLSEVGPASAVHQWRATTLTLLAKREAFIQQRQQDTQAVVHAIMETLSEILPPPSQLEGQIEEQLERVMKAAVDLSIEMRTQRAEYMMLPPLQPEYDANGDLASKVQFNAALMNERSGDTVSNEDLEAQQAVVRIVLFPLVVKKGDDKGEGDEEIVVCPAQVLVAKPKKQVRVFSPGSVAAASRVSMQSNMPADYGEGSAI